MNEVSLRVADRKPEILKLDNKMKRLFVQNWVGMCCVRQREQGFERYTLNDKNLV
jgi:hypothetical protein